MSSGGRKASFTPWAREAASVWEALVDRRYSTDDQIVKAVAARFRLPIANLALQDPQVQDALPEQVAREVVRLLVLAPEDLYISGQKVLRADGRW